MSKVLFGWMWRLPESVHLYIYGITRSRLVQIWNRASGQIIGYRWTRIYPVAYDGRYEDQKVAMIARCYEDFENWKNRR